MKIFVDIGHPAHVHYFRNMIKLMEQSGHSFLITARDKEVTQDLMKYYKLNYISRGKGSNNLIGKIVYTFKADWQILKLCKKWSPDIFISFGSPYAAHVAAFMGKPHIAFTDTEHAKLGIIGFANFSEVIVTPKCFLNNFGSKHIRIDGYFELGYLSPKYFKVNLNVLNQYFNENKTILFRYVSWNASHDIGQKGISDSSKISLAKFFRDKCYNIYISAEGPLPREIEKYRIRIDPSDIHSFITGVDLFIGESGTMANEAALLGIPTVFVNSLDAGVFQEEVKYGLLYSLRNERDLFPLIDRLIQDKNIKTKHENAQRAMLKDKIEITDFMVWFIENYPQSKEQIKCNPDLVYKFSFK